MNIYRLDAIIDDINIVNIGLFNTKKMALFHKRKWENFDGEGIKIECYLTKVKLNEVNPERFLTERQLEELKPLLRDYKLEEIGIK